MENLTRLILELFGLKNMPRAGWLRVLVPAGSAETVASHSALSMMIATILSHAEGANEERSAVLALFHDTGETRSGDLTPVHTSVLEKMGLTKDAIDEAAEKEQERGLPKGLRAFLRAAHTEYSKAQTIEARVARDAGAIDQGIQALLYQKQGYDTEQFMPSNLLTESGKRLWQDCLDSREELTDWWGKPS